MPATYELLKQNADVKQYYTQAAPIQRVNYNLKSCNVLSHYYN